MEYSDLYLKYSTLLDKAKLGATQHILGKERIRMNLLPKVVVMLDHEACQFSLLLLSQSDEVVHFSLHFLKLL